MRSWTASRIEDSKPDMALATARFTDCSIPSNNGSGGGGGGVSISTTDVRPGIGPFCNGQITWEDGPLPGSDSLLCLLKQDKAISISLR